MDLMSRVGLMVLTTGSTSTFKRRRYRKTINDISLITDHLATRIANRQMIKDFSIS